ncbi:type II toxin-antitoxin system HipA family toxin [Nocardioides caeni]|uniref:type II toxin-antitoxin system HipA family toxin n=1 Tax=Nocardioides caeni TaxID=574700 RepID=UPI0013050853|nr:HipA domain-containing protein [Nocardioides caeni]
MDEGPEQIAAMLHPELESLKDVDRADVYKSGQLAAHLTRTSAGLIEFAYTRDWITHAGPPVASTLPVTTDVITMPGGALPAFFTGLLPEGRRLTELREGVKTSPDDELSLLLGVGSDTIGDVQVVPEGAELAAANPALSIVGYDLLSFRDVLRAAGLNPDRVGLPGVQDKLSAQMISLPVDARGRRQLLKLNPPRVRHLVENEHFFINAAKHAGIRTVDARIVADKDDELGLAVTRFDRIETPAGETLSLPVEDGCQVLGLPPASKYSIRTEELLLRLTGLCEAPIPAAAEFLTQIVQAYLSINGDAHAKNFSVMQDQTGRWQPTPAYDLPSTYFYDDHKLALSVSGEKGPNITGKKFLELGTTLGLRPRAIEKIIARTSDATEVWLEQIDVLPYPPDKLHGLKKAVQARLRFLRVR